MPWMFSTRFHQLSPSSGIFQGFWLQVIEKRTLVRWFDFIHLEGLIIYLPGDSKWPFHPLVGGHEQPLEFGSRFHHPKKVTAWITWYYLVHIFLGGEIIHLLRNMDIPVVFFYFSNSSANFHLIGFKPPWVEKLNLLFSCQPLIIGFLKGGWWFP